MDKEEYEKLINQIESYEQEVLNEQEKHKQDNVDYVLGKIAGLEKAKKIIIKLRFGGN